MFLPEFVELKMWSHRKVVYIFFNSDKIFYYFPYLSVIVSVDEIGESYSVHIVIDGRVLVVL